MCYVGVNDFELSQAWRWQVVLPGLLTSAMLWANYPITQVYQHEEDIRRGDVTLSARLGIVGTFYFAASVFSLAVAGFLFYLKFLFGELYAWIFLIAVLPVTAYFFYWFFLIMRDQRAAVHRHTMRLNLISGICLNIFFSYLFIRSTQVLQAL
jgi:1,4-dihydroxy-2-naphthoate octaprenyltransferase